MKNICKHSQVPRFRFASDGIFDRVQARPGATWCGYEIAFTFYGLGFPSPHLDKLGLCQGFKGYKMLIPVTLYSIAWIGLFHPLGETWNSTRFPPYRLSFRKLMIISASKVFRGNRSIKGFRKSYMSIANPNHARNFCKWLVFCGLINR